MENTDLKDKVKRLVEAGVPEPKIAEFIKSYNSEKFTSYKKSQGTDWKRIGYQTLGGMAGAIPGAAAGGVGLPVGIGLGSSMAGQAYDLAQEGLGNKEPEPLAERATGAAEDFILDVISPAVLNKVGRVARSAYGKALGSPFKKFRTPETVSSLVRHQNIGTQPTPGVLTGSTFFNRTESPLSQFMFSAGPFQKNAQYNLAQLKEASTLLAKEYGPILSNEEMGLLLKKGAKQVIEKQDEVWGKLFTQVGKDIGKDRIPINKTVKMLGVLTRESQTGPSSGVASIAEDISRKAQRPPSMMEQMSGQNQLGLQWDDLKKFRSKVGNLMRDPALVSTRDIQSGDLKRLYAALTSDMESAALAAGPKIHARWRAANKYFEAKITKDLPVIENVLKKVNPDEVFGWVMGSSGKGGTRLKILKNQLTKEEFDAVSGTVLGRMGLSTVGRQNYAGDAFSAGTFMTNWNRLSRGAKNILFKNNKYSNLSKELDDFSKVVGDFKEIDQYANRSNTGSVLSFFSIMSAIGATGAGIVAGPAGFAGSMVGLGSVSVAPRAIANLMTDPNFVRWLATGVRLSKYNPNSMKMHLGRLMVMRFKDDIQDDIDELIRNVVE